MLHYELEMVNSSKKTQIAFMLHIQPETLSRVFKRLTRDNIIKVEDKKYIIVNEEKLLSIFQGVGL